MKSLIFFLIIPNRSTISVDWDWIHAKISTIVITFVKWLTISFENRRQIVSRSYIDSRVSVLRYGIFHKEALATIPHIGEIIARRVAVGYSVRNRKPSSPAVARRNEIGGSYAAKTPRSAIAHKSAPLASFAPFPRPVPLILPSRPFSSSLISFIILSSILHRIADPRDVSTCSTEWSIIGLNESGCERKRDRPMALGIATLDIRGILSIHKPILMIIQQMQISFVFALSAGEEMAALSNVNNYTGARYAPMIIETKRIWRAITILYIVIREIKGRIRSELLCAMFFCTDKKITR